MSTDADIVDRIRAGDREAFVSLVHRYQGAVFALAHHYVRDFHDAQEVAQETFVKVYRRLDTLSLPQSFPAWLRSIVHTEAMMRLRSNGRRVPAVTLNEESPGVQVRDAQRHAAQQRRASVHEALGTLPEDLRLLVELRYLGGCNSREIGDLLGMKPGTVRYQLHKAIESLREVFECGTVHKNGKPVAMPEKRGEPLADRIYIDFVESTGPYAKFNDPRISSFRACTIHIHTDDSGSFQIDHLFPGATYTLRIAFEGKEYERTVTLGQEAQTRVALRLGQD